MTLKVSPPIPEVWGDNEITAWLFSFVEYKKKKKKTVEHPTPPPEGIQGSSWDRASKPLHLQVGSEQMLSGELLKAVVTLGVTETTSWLFLPVL